MAPKKVSPESICLGCSKKFNDKGRLYTLHGVWPVDTQKLCRSD